MVTKSKAGGPDPQEDPKKGPGVLPDATPVQPRGQDPGKSPVTPPDATPRATQGQETEDRPKERDDRTPEQRAGSHTEAAQDAASAPPTTPPAARNPEPVEVRQTTMTTLGEITNETRPGFDAGGTPVIPNAPLRDRIAEIGDYPRSYDEAVLLARYRSGEVDEYGRERQQDDEGDEPSDERED